MDLKPIMPKEHGLWAWVLLPLLTGAGSASGRGDRLFFVLPAVFFWFMALTPARMIYKNSKKNIRQGENVLFWCAAYAIPGSAFAFMAMIIDPWLAPVFFAAAPAFYLGVLASHHGFQRKESFEFGGIIFLSLGSFLGAYSAAGELKTADVAVWLFILAFLLERNIQSRKIVRAGDWFSNPPSLPNLPGVLNFNLLVSVSALVAALAVAGVFGVKKSVALAFLPGLLVSAHYRAAPPATLRRVGYTELGLSIVFAVGLSLLIKYTR